MSSSRSTRQIRGWQLDGTNKWWPAMFGQPPYFPASRWTPIYYPEKTS